MNRPSLILSAGVADARLADPVWAGELTALAETARIALLLLGDGGAASFDPLMVANALAPRAGGVGLVPTIDTTHELPVRVARALSALDTATKGLSGWQPSTLAKPTPELGARRGTDFVAATRGLWDHWGADACHSKPHPLLVQTDADPLWSHVAPDIVIIDMDSPKPPPGPKCLLRTYTALAGLDQIEALYREGIIDGIHLTPPHPRRGLEEFAETMLPALIERGLVPATRCTGTLRQRLGLPAVAPALDRVMSG